MPYCDRIKGNAFKLRNDKGDTYVVHPDFIINRKNATLLDREDNNMNINPRDEASATLSNQEDVVAVSVSSQIAKRAITETPSHASITDITTRKNVGKEQLPSALSHAHEHKIWLNTPVSLPITHKYTNPIGTLNRSDNATHANTQANVANAAPANTANLTHAKVKSRESANALTKEGTTNGTPAKVNARQANPQVTSVTGAKKSETVLVKLPNVEQGHTVHSHR